jgi:hypothetical protein
VLLLEPLYRRRQVREQVLGAGRHRTNNGYSQDVTHIDSLARDTLICFNDLDYRSRFAYGTRFEFEYAWSRLKTAATETGQLNEITANSADRTLRALAAGPLGNKQILAGRALLVAIRETTPTDDKVTHAVIEADQHITRKDEQFAALRQIISVPVRATALFWMGQQHHVKWVLYVTVTVMLIFGCLDVLFGHTILDWYFELSGISGGTITPMKWTAKGIAILMIAWTLTMFRFGWRRYKTETSHLGSMFEKL